MKNLITLALGLLLVSSLSAQQYFVMKVTGSPTLAGKPLAKGMKLTPDDKVVFSAKSEMVALIQPGKGRVNLMAEQQQPNSQGEFVALLKDALRPPKDIKMSGTRAGEKVTTVADLVKIISAGGGAGSPQKLLVIDKLELEIAIPEFAMGPQRFFFLSFNYQGRPARQKLQPEGNKLVLSEQILYVNNSRLDPADLTDMKLHFAEILPGNQTKITDIGGMNLVFASKAEVVAELKTIQQAYPEADFNEMFTGHAYSYLKEFYGEPYKPELREVLEQELGLKALASD